MQIRYRENWQAAAREALSVALPNCLRLVFATAVAIVVITLDTYTALDGGLSVLYVLPIFISADLGNKHIILSAAVFCAVLSILHFAIEHHSLNDLVPVMTLASCLAAIFLVTALALKQAGTRKNLEAQARLLEMTSDAILLRDDQDRYIFWNRGAEKLFGFTAEEALGKRAEEITDTHLVNGRVDAEDTLRRYGSWEGQIKVRAKDGRLLDLAVGWSQVRSPSGKPVAIATAAIDVTEKLAAEKEMRESESRFRGIFETLAVTIWEHDVTAVKARLDELALEGVTDIKAYLDQHPEFIDSTRELMVISDVNPTGLKLLGAKTREEFPLLLSDILIENDPSFAQFLQALHDGKQIFRSETAVRRIDGSTVPVLVAISFPEDGSLEKVQATIVDISERVAMQDALEKARQEFDQVSRVAVIGEISASIAHEVNQPLSATASFVTAARRWLKKEPPELSEADTDLGDALEAVQHAASVVNRVRVLLGKSKPQGSEFKVDQAIQSALRMSHNSLEEGNIRVRMSFDPSVRMLIGDPVLLQQVFVNVIGNAVHAMENVPKCNRQLTISTRVEDGKVRITFTDSGCGIPEDETILFKPFATTKPQGMGLGLTVCRSIIDAHGGEITLRNRDDGKGATVHLLLPMSETTPFQPSGTETTQALSTS